jgi:hypothetical protein
VKGASTGRRSGVGKGRPSYHREARDAVPGRSQRTSTSLASSPTEELDALIGVSWGESSPTRKGYRNGSYTHESFDHLWSA